MIELLKTFCDKSNYGKDRDIDEVFGIGNDSYATDGHILVKLNDVVTEKSVNESVYNAVSSMVTKCNQIEDAEFKPFIIDEKIVLESKDNCKQCKGTGKMSECQNCEGEGTLTFNDDADNEYECECKECNGEGQIDGEASLCENCDGNGYNIRIIKAGQRFGENLISVHLLKKINQLPDCRLAYGAAKYKEFVCFRFNGGCGIIMPLRDMDKEVD